MYRKVNAGCLFRDEEGTLYSLDIASPNAFEDEAAALNDRVRYRFEKRGGEMLLIAYPEGIDVVEEVPGKRRIMRTLPAGQPIATYDTRTFLDGPLNKIQKFVPEEERGTGHLMSNTFIDVLTLFDDLFPNLEEGQSIYISSGELQYVNCE